MYYEKDLEKANANHFRGRKQKHCYKKTKLIVRSTEFGDVEALSDLFLCKRLERLHVPHRLDVVLPEVGFVLRQSQRLKPRGWSPSVNKTRPKLIPRVGVQL